MSSSRVRADSRHPVGPLPAINWNGAGVGFRNSLKRSGGADPRRRDPEASTRPASGLRAHRPRRARCHCTRSERRPGGPPDGIARSPSRAGRHRRGGRRPLRYRRQHAGLARGRGARTPSSSPMAARPARARTARSHGSFQLPSWTWGQSGARIRRTQSRRPHPDEPGAHRRATTRPGSRTTSRTRAPT